MRHEIINDKINLTEKEREYQSKMLYNFYLINGDKMALIAANYSVKMDEIVKSFNELKALNAQNNHKQSFTEQDMENLILTVQADSSKSHKKQPVIVVQNIWIGMSPNLGYHRKGSTEALLVAEAVEGMNQNILRSDLKLDKMDAQAQYALADEGLLSLQEKYRSLSNDYADFRNDWLTKQKNRSIVIYIAQRQ